MDSKEILSNIRAHEKITSIGFPHKLVNLIALAAIKEAKHKSIDKRSGSLRILDVGCGTGYLLEKMVKKGWDAWGVDPFPRGASLKSPLKKRVIRGTVQQVQSGRFDVITVIEVLEHLEDYMLQLRLLATLLHPEGAIVATVPNNWNFRVLDPSSKIKEPEYGHLWQFDQDGFSKDLSTFFNFVSVKPIYSRTIDRRLFRFTRVLPVKVVIKLSGLLVKKNTDGAWLLGFAEEKKGAVEKLPSPSGKYYQDAIAFK